MPSTSTVKTSASYQNERLAIEKQIKIIDNEIVLTKSDIEMYATFAQLALVIGFPILFLSLTVAAVAVFTPLALPATIAIAICAFLIYSMILVNVPLEGLNKKITKTISPYFLEDLETELCELQVKKASIDREPFTDSISQNPLTIHTGDLFKKAPEKSATESNLTPKENPFKF